MNKSSNFKRLRLGSYIVISNKDNTKHIAAFKNNEGKLKFAKIKTEILDEFIKDSKILKSQKNRFVRHIEHSFLTEHKLNERILHKAKSIEDEYLADEGAREIVREIWNLPSPQNRRVYMNIVDEISITEIAKIEKCSFQAVQQSLKIGIRNLQKKLKNF